MGIKDDILIINPWKKLAGQIIAALIISVLADIRITHLFGLLGIDQLPYIVSILLTILVLLVIINGFNLIDGIDGLASGIGILTSSVFGIWFWMTGNIAYTILSFSFTGSLLAFFSFNVFSNKNKIFLGDTGSLVTGLVIGVLACSFLQLESTAEGVADIQSSPAFAFGILIVPLFDTLRVFALRIIQGKSPFVADRQHIHHRLLQLGITHLQATLILVSVNMFFIALCYLLQGIGIIGLMAVVLGLATLLSYILMILVREKAKKEIDTEYSFNKIWKRKNKKKSIIEKDLSDRTLHYPNKVNTGLN
jgi:UDP-N-acetylmuramyl pentapeptide phosphotransferase/UDP-N-acetylglucosamine-1-phosphate transferase